MVVALEITIKIVEEITDVLVVAACGLKESLDFGRA